MSDRTKFLLLLALLGLSLGLLWLANSALGSHLLLQR